MSESPHIAIIGRGIAGLSAAFELVSRGFSVSLIGPLRTELSASHASQGVLSTKGHLLAESHAFRAKMHGQLTIKSWLAKIEKITGAEIRKDFSGVWEYFFSADEFATINKRVHRGEFSGCHRGKVSSKEEFYRDWYGKRLFKNDPIGSLFYPSDCWFDAQQTMSIMEDYFVKSGVTIHDQCVTDFSVKNEKIIIQTKLGHVFADEVVIAAGFESQQLLSQLELPLDLVPAAGQVIDFPLVDKVADRTFVKGASSFSVHCDRLRFGSISKKTEYYGSSDKLAGRLMLVEQLVDKMGISDELFNDSEIVDLVGIRARTRDRLPLIGPIHSERLGRRVFVFTGLYKNGLQLAHLCAFQIANILQGIDGVFSIEPFSPCRYS